MLPAVVAASADTPVLFDSGVRSGTDVVKALAMGARAGGVGRPYVYGLALGGDVGAAHVLKCLLAEADLLMAVNGYPTISYQLAFWCAISPIFKHAVGSCKLRCTFER